MFYFLCELCIVIVNVHMVTLQLLVNRESWTTNLYLGLAQRQNSVDLLATAHVTTCTHTQSHKNLAFSRFSRVFSA